MNFLRKAGETLASLWDATWYSRNGFHALAGLVGAGNTKAGKPIDVERAMRCSVPFICTDVITKTLASMPLPLLIKRGENTEIARQSQIWKILNKRPNAGQTAQTLRRVATHHALNYGNGFVKIVRQKDSPDAEAIGAFVLHPKSFIKKDIVRNEPLYVFKGDGKEISLKNYEVMHLMGHSDDGWTGKGAVELGKEPIAQLLSIEEYGTTFFSRGGMSAGLVKKMIPFARSEARKQFREDFEKQYEGTQGFHKKVIVEGDWDFKPIGSNPTESQMVEARLSMVPEIARFYNLTPHLAGDLSRAHFANVEHLWIEFLNVTQGPWMTQWEQEIERVMLTPKQVADGYYAKHNTASFLRGDFETRMRGYSIVLQNGLASINECRSLEDWDPIPGGDAHHIQLNMQTVPGTGSPTASQTATMLKISEGNRRRQ